MADLAHPHLRILCQPFLRCLATGLKGTWGEGGARYERGQGMQHPLWKQGVCQPQCPWVKAKTKGTASLRTYKSMEAKERKAGSLLKHRTTLTAVYLQASLRLLGQRSLRLPQNCFCGQDKRLKNTRAHEKHSNKG